MSYTNVYPSRINWENEPSIVSPINATNLNKMDYALYEHDQTLETWDTTKANQSDLLLSVKSIDYNTSTGVFVFTWQNGTTKTVDLNIEKIPVSFSMSPQGVITMTTDDGTTYTADVGSLIKTYTFTDSSEIDFTVTTDASGNKTITAGLVSGSITGDKLEPNYLANCQSAANSASASATTAGTKAQDSEAWAVGERGGVPVPSTDPAYENNAKWYAEHGTGSSLVGLSDTDITNPADGQALVFDAPSTKWKNKTVATGSTLAISTTESTLYGQTITLSNGGAYTRTATFNNYGFATFQGVTVTGTVTLTTSDGSQTATTVVSIPYFGNYPITLAFWSATVNIQGDQNIYGEDVLVADSSHVLVDTVTLSAVDGTGTFIATKPDTYTFSITFGGQQYVQTLAVTEETTYSLSIQTIPNGRTVTTLNDVNVWIACAGLTNDNNYSTFAEVIADTELFDTLLRDSNACDYLARSTTWAAAENQIPKMTSNTTPSGVASASSEYNSSYAAWKAFDGDDNTKWLTTASATNNFIKYKFDDATIIKSFILKLNVDSQSSVLNRTFVLQGSNNDSNWTDLSTFTIKEQGLDLSLIIADDINNSTAYTYYRLFCTDILYASGSYSVMVKTLELSTTPLGMTQIADVMARIGKYDYCANALLANEDWLEAIAESPYILDFMGKGEVPVMTSNSTPSGICIASSVYNSNNYNVWMSFKNNAKQASYISTGLWLPTDADSQTEAAFIAYQFASAKKINSIKIHSSYAYRTTGDSAIKNIKVIAKNDADANYVELATIPITFEKKGDTSTYVIKDIILNFDNDTAYERYGVKICWDFSTSNAPISFQPYDIQMYSKKPLTNVIHSCPNDTLYMLDSNNDSVILATTNSDGVGELDWSDFEPGVYNIYSSVAKDPQNLSNDYYKAVKVTKTTFGGTTDAYIMPDAVKTLEWFGYMSDNCEDCTSANGWSNASQYYPLSTPTHNTNSIRLTSTSNSSQAIGSKTPVNASKIIAITKRVSSNSDVYGYMTLENSKVIRTNDYVQLSGSVGVMQKTEFTPSGSSGYACIVADNGKTLDIFALLYE